MHRSDTGPSVCPMCGGHGVDLVLMAIGGVVEPCPGCRPRRRAHSAECDDYALEQAHGSVVDAEDMDCVCDSKDGAA